LVVNLPWFSFGDAVTLFHWILAHGQWEKIDDFSGHALPSQQDRFDGSREPVFNIIVEDLPQLLSCQLGPVELLKVAQIFGFLFDMEDIMI
jgi:hypothetical protein